MHNFKKQFGQNFLKNAKFARLMVDSLKLTPEDTIIEIGPGDGMVTKLLLDSGCKVMALEIDDDLIPKLTAKFAAYSNFKLIHQSILDANIEQLLIQNEATNSIKVVGSLPYNISKKIIDLFIRFNINSASHKVKVCSFIVQEEVAKDYAALPPKSSFLSNYSRIFAKVRKLESIPNHMFYPQPKVNGAILKFEIKEEILANYLDLHKLIRVGFSNPRKTLSNNLKSSGKYNLENIEELYNQIGFKITVRPAEVEFEQWEKLAGLIQPINP